MRRIAIGFVLVVAVWMTGCMTTTVQTARTNGADNFQFGVEPGVTGISAQGETFVLPSFSIAGRYGVSETIDIGGRLGMNVYEVQGKFQFTDPADYDSVVLSLAPALTVFGAGGGGGGGLFIDGKSPLLIGVPVGSSELTLGARTRTLVVAGGGGGTSSVGALFMLGGSVGFAAAVTEKFRIMPEFGIDVPIAGAAAVNAGGVGGSGAGFGTGGLFFAGAVGLLFGGPDGPQSAGTPSDATME